MTDKVGRPRGAAQGGATQNQRAGAAQGGAQQNQHAGAAQGGAGAEAKSGEAPERIAKRLARAGVASRRDIERMIGEGRITLNGRKLTTPAVTVTQADRIIVDGVEIGAPERPRLWRYHKPAGLVTSARDEKGRPTVFERLPEDLPRVLSVGRLDIASEGLLLLTNDGELKRRLELPSTGWMRKYRVRAHGAPSEASLDRLREGIEVDGVRYQPMLAQLDKIQGANSWLTVGIREGKNREVRRALEAVGLTVNRLIRVSYGPFQLGEIAEGAVEEVRGKVLADQLGVSREGWASAGGGVRSALAKAAAAKASRVAGGRAGTGAATGAGAGKPGPVRFTPMSGAAAEAKRSGKPPAPGRGPGGGAGKGSGAASGTGSVRRPGRGTSGKPAWRRDD